MRSALLASCCFLALVAGPVTAAEGDSARVRVADGFDFPVRKPDATGAYKSRGYRAHGHLGEDWNTGPGDQDLGEPVYSIAHGIVVLARDVRLGWGNVVIVRHAYPDGGGVAVIDSLYGHLQEIAVTEGQQVGRGDRLGTIGNNRGMYDAHLHFEIRKNIELGMNRACYARDSTNYHDPTTFIGARRALEAGPRHSVIAINTFKTPSEAYAAATKNGGTLRFPGPGAATAGADDRIRVIARRGSFKVNRYEDMEFR